MKKILVAIVMGGPSAEHDVSLRTGEMVFAALDPKKYQPFKVVISRKGRWPITLAQLKKTCDVVFLAMHGEYGEDGTIQKLLEKWSIPYTGSQAKASVLGMDKIICHRFFKKAGLLCPLFTTSEKTATIKRYGLPLVIKPIDRGSSVGTTIINQWSDLIPALKEAKRYSARVMAQSFISGRELTCAVLERKGKIIALPVIEIKPKKSGFFDYQEKYSADGAEEIVPAPLSGNQTKKAQAIAVTAHRTIGCRSYSRTDMILDKKGRVSVLEINTLPGLTATSLLPKAAQVAGISFSELLDIIIENAFI